MKALSFVLVFCMVSILAPAQEKTYSIALSYGPYSAPNLKQSHSKDHLLIDFSYRIATRWAITSGFVAGQFDYYDDVRSNADKEITKYTTATTNARGYESHAYAIIEYIAINRSRLYLHTGLGVGMVIQRLKFPYRQPCSSGCAVFIGEESSVTAEFPVSTEVYYLITNRIGIGIKAGSFIKSDFSITGAHIGPQIRVKL